MPHQQRELTLLNKIATDHQSTIDILHVSESNYLSMRQENNLYYIKEKLRNNTLNFVKSSDENVINAIYTHIRKNQTDILVMINRRHSFLEYILFQDSLDKISLAIDIPLLALQNMRRN
jgi:nucleotide-binding universal stress UspA family protein